MSVISDCAPAKNPDPPFRVSDVKGNRIVTGSIVGMADPHGSWSRYQGLVVYPDSDLEGEGYTVPVFFNREVSSSEFRFYDPENLRVGVDEWDREFLARCIKGDTEFLFDPAVWMRCPRVRFFKPEELLVEKRWKVEGLCNRVFRNRWHSLYDLPFWGKFGPEEYMCWFEGCNEPAEPELALGNVWGTVSALCLCKKHHREIHGLCGDDLPKMKPSFFLRDGRPVSAKGEVQPLAA